MKKCFSLSVLLVSMLLETAALAQQTPATVGDPAAPGVSNPAGAGVAAPRLVKFAGVLKDGADKPLNGVVGVTFALYKEQQGGAPLWLETQNVQADAQGNYVALLGATKSEGMALDLFTSGESRWLGVQALGSGEAEQPRVLLVSVPYALKAADADTVGGMPASAFVLAQPSGTQAPSSIASGQQIVSQVAVAGAGMARDVFRRDSGVITGATGTANKLTKWLDAGGMLGDSAVFESGGLVGIGTTTPANPLSVIATTNNGGFTTVGSFGVMSPASGWTDVFSLQAGAANLRGGAVVFGETGAGAFGAAQEIISAQLNDFQFKQTGNYPIDFWTNGTERMRILGNGNVGIGTTTPSYALHVNNPSGNADIVVQGNSANGDTGIRILGDRNWKIGSNLGGVGTGKFTIWDLSVGASRLVIDTSGNVGIGTSGPTQKLDVHGNANISGNLTLAGSLNASAVTAGSLTGIVAIANGGTGNGTSVATHNFFGNNTSGTGAPAYGPIGTSDVSPNWYAADTGAVDAYEVTLAPAATALSTGLEVSFLPANANSITTPTLNVNGLGARTITKNGTAEVALNDLSPTAVAKVIYDGTKWQLQNPPQAPASVELKTDNGGEITLFPPSGFAICTNTCTVTLPAPAAGLQFCIRNDDKVNTVITLAGRPGMMYEYTSLTGYGTPGMTATSGGAIGDQICLVGRDATHYLVFAFNGTWTMN